MGVAEPAARDLSSDDVLGTRRALREKYLSEALCPGGRPVRAQQATHPDGASKTTHGLDARAPNVSHVSDDEVHVHQRQVWGPDEAQMRFKAGKPRKMLKLADIKARVRVRGGAKGKATAGPSTRVGTRNHPAPL